MGYRNYGGVYDVLFFVLQSAPIFDTHSSLVFLPTLTKDEYSLPTQLATLAIIGGSQMLLFCIE